MLIFDELKKNDPQLRLVALVLVAGFLTLLTGLWWVQVVTSRKYQTHQETQAYRTIRIPAIRGKILDREGRVLAENRPRYNLCVYFDDLGGAFQQEYDRLRPQPVATSGGIGWKFWRRSSSSHLNRMRLSRAQIDALTWQARFNVVDEICRRVGAQLGVSLPLDPKRFVRSYEEERAMPFVIMPNLNDAQMARFEENQQDDHGVNLQLLAVRYYPYHTTAAHVLGEMQQDNQSAAGEDSFFNYRLPDYRGVTGVEAIYDDQLHGHAGMDSVLVNSQGLRQSEVVVSQPEAGENLVLTLDLDIQQAAESSILKNQGPNASASAVVMEVHSGDVLALASSPTFDPNDFAQGITAAKYKEIQQLTAEKNRATIENYAPGSIFKTVVALAALERGLNPHAIYDVQENPERPGRGCIYIGRRKIEDTAPPGPYDFEKAFMHSSNAYFITNGLRAGVENIIRMGDRFHLGERTGLLPHQETAGEFPTLARVTAPEWRAGDTANLCIGQGEIAVTPIQMAVLISAIANGGSVLWPQLVDHFESMDTPPAPNPSRFSAGLVRDELNVSARSLQVVRHAMLADVQSQGGSGTRAAVPGFEICGKTGTAQIQDVHNRTVGHNYWFASFAPYENPKYAVVVMVQSYVEGGSGGLVCGPIAHDIYEEIIQKTAAPNSLANRKVKPNSLPSPPL